MREGGFTIYDLRFTIYDLRLGGINYEDARNGTSELALQEQRAES